MSLSYCWYKWELTYRFQEGVVFLPFLGGTHFIIKMKWNSYKTEQADICLMAWSKDGVIAMTTMWGEGDHFTFYRN